MKKANKLFDYLKVLKSITDKNYPLLDSKDISNKQLLLTEIDDLIETLKYSTKEYISNEISISEFDILLRSIVNSYDYLRSENSILDAIVTGYLTPVFQATTS